MSLEGRMDESVAGSDLKPAFISAFLVAPGNHHRHIGMLVTMSRHRRATGNRFQSKRCAKERCSHRLN